MNQNQTVTMPLNDPFGKATTGKLGMWLFIIVDGLSFTGLLIAGIALRAASPEIWPVAGDVLDIPLTAFNTFLLICTSFTMVMALNCVQKGDQTGLKKFLGLTMAGGWYSWGYRYMNTPILLWLIFCLVQVSMQLSFMLPPAFMVYMYSPG